MCSEQRGDIFLGIIFVTFYGCFIRIAGQKAFENQEIEPHNPLLNKYNFTHRRGGHATEVEWTKAPYALTLDELCTKEPPHSFLHNGTIYVDILWCALTHEGLCYGVVAHGAATCTSLLGSAVVTPVTRVPPPPIWPTP